MNLSLNELFPNGDLWTALGGAGLTGFALLITLTAFAGKRFHRRWAIVSIAALCAGITGTWMTAPHPNDVLVRGDEAALLLSPFDGAEVKGSLAKGERVRATKTHGDFAYVSSAKATGWVRKDAVDRYVGGW